MRTDDSGAGHARPALSDLPLSGETWEVGVYAVAELLGLDPGTLPPAVFILIGARNPDRPIAADVHEERDIATAAADLVVGACHEPAEGSPRLPAALLVDRPELKALLEERFLGSGVNVGLESSLPIPESLAVECLMAAMQHGAEGSYADAGVPTETAGELFDAARTFYKAAPWKVLDDTEPLELQLPGPDGSRYAVVMGSGEVTTGLALFRDMESLASMYNEAAGPIGATLSLTYDARAEVPPALVEEARREKWKLASSKAFPIAMSTSALEKPGGVPDVRYVNGEEAEELVLALRAVAAFCTRHRRELRSGSTAEGAEPTRSATGETVIVRLCVLEQQDGPEWTGDAENGNGDAPAATTGASGGGFLPELDRIRALATELVGARSIVQRLRWSFFRDEFPFYLDDDPAAEELASIRFLEWAIFGAPIPPDGRTIAQRAIEESRGLSEAERRRLLSVAQPRYGLYEVEEVELDVGMLLRDLPSGETFRVRERLATHRLQAGAVLMGPIFPDGDGLWILSAALASYPELLPEMRAATKRLDPADAELALTLEAGLYGASTEWIQNIETPNELRQAYESFVKAMGGKTSGLPTLAAMQKRIREAESPIDVLQPTVERDWWLIEEAKVFTAFFQRLWNMTSRPELDGRSPDEVYRRPPPPSRPGGGGKRKPGKSKKRRK